MAKGTELITIAGPVIVYGTAAGVVYGFNYLPSGLER